MRVSKDAYFLHIAVTVASRSTCLDKQVGCVLVDRYSNILSTGYNGAPRGMEHCQVCKSKIHGKDHCPAAHAEQNAMLLALANSVDICYCTLEPCIHCTRMLMNTTCKRVVFINKTTKSGSWLWEKLHDSTTWEHRPV